MRVFVIGNPTAGRSSAFKVLLSTLKERCNLDLPHCPTLGDLRRLLTATDLSSFDRIIVAGGDGTLGEVANYLPRGHPPVCLIPVGTVNVLAVELGIPLEVSEAADLLTSGRSRRIDLGLLRRRGEEPRRFVLGLGAGLPGRAAAGVSPALKRAAGRLAYLPPLLGGLLGPERVEVEASGRVFSGEAIVAMNTSNYAGRFRPIPNVLPDDGLFHLLVMKVGGLLDMAQKGLSARRGTLSGEEGVEVIETAKVTVRSRSPIETDGDPRGHGPAEAEILPSALEILVPGD